MGMRYDTALATGTIIVDGHGAVNGFSWGFALQSPTRTIHKPGPKMGRGRRRPGRRGNPAGAALMR
jgi:hypothetical protein